jgi:hypothetical protein
MSVSFTVDQRGLQRAMTTYAVTRRKSDADVVNKAMRYVLPFAAKKVRDKTPGEMHIKMQLMTGARSVIGGPKRSQYSNTLAAAIIASRLRKRGQLIALSPKIGPQVNGKLKKSINREFFDKVRTFVDAKKRSAHYLRAGFIPAFRVFNVPFRGAGKQRHFKGMSRGLKARPSLAGVAEAFAANRREGAYKIAPNAFRQAVRETRHLFLKWLREDVRRDAIRSGFY